VSISRTEPPITAVAYYRHSAEDKQENSIQIQRDETRKFAAQHKISIIHEEADEGKTGLTASRPGFNRLFTNWILSTEAPPFIYVLVYDVSRWGRFQDQDEAAYFEFLCRSNGKEVIYVSRGFPTEGQQLISHLQTSIERYMAAEYSRQLSEKVFLGSVKVSELGFSAGGAACYGLTRLLLDVERKPKKRLQPGEQKSLSNERVTFVPAGDNTTETVKEIFDLFISRWRTPSQIAEILNEKGVTSPKGKPWRKEMIIRILDNEVYTGTRLYNKTWARLKQKRRTNPHAKWVVRQEAFPAVIDQINFKTAQERLHWLIPIRWKRSVRFLNKVRALIYRDLTRVLVTRGMDEQDAIITIKRLPLVFTVGSYRGSMTQWCLCIEERARHYECVLVVSIGNDNPDVIDRLFAVPINDFDSMNINCFSENDDCYSRYVISDQIFEEKILSLIPQRSA
jgi:DNA invertase Pin-like site-specific DNA recombinase